MNDKWWGYLHSNGDIIVKRYFGNPKDYTDGVEGNDFVVKVVEPFSAPSMDDAILFVKYRTDGWRK